MVRVQGFGNSVYVDGRLACLAVFRGSHNKGRLTEAPLGDYHAIGLRKSPSLGKYKAIHVGFEAIKASLAQSDKDSCKNTLMS